MCIKTPCKNVICTSNHWAPVTWKWPPRKWHSRIAIKTERPSGHKCSQQFEIHPRNSFSLTSQHMIQMPLSLLIWGGDTQMKIGAKTVPIWLDEMSRPAQHPLSLGEDRRVLSVPPGESNPSCYWLWSSDLQTENISFVVLNHQICDTYHQKPRKWAYDYECIIKYFSYNFSLPKINFLRYYRKIPNLFHSSKTVKENRGSRKKTRKIRGKKSIIAYLSAFG